MRRDGEGLQHLVWHRARELIDVSEEASLRRRFADAALPVELEDRRIRLRRAVEPSCGRTKSSPAACSVAVPTTQETGAAIDTSLVFPARSVEADVDCGQRNLAEEAHTGCSPGNTDVAQCSHELPEPRPTGTQAIPQREATQVMRRNLRPEAEDKPTACRAVEFPRGNRRHHWAARERNHDRGPELEAWGRLLGDREWQEGIVATSAAQSPS